MNHPARERAVALEYNEIDKLPRVVASGAGEVARQIIRIAEQNKIPIHENSELADLLGQLNFGEYITPETFRLVAEVVCFLYGSDKAWREAHQSLGTLLAEPRAALT